jgi:hypothetical protein
MKKRDFYPEIVDLHKTIVAEIVALMVEHGVFEVDLLGSDADHAYVTGYPSDGAGAMTLEVGKVYYEDCQLKLDVILDIDTEELAANDPNGDIGDAYQCWKANDFEHFIPCAGIEQVYDCVWQVLEQGKGRGLKKVDMWLNMPIDIMGYLDIIHIDTIHEGDEYVEDKNEGIVYFSEMEEDVIAEVMKVIDENEGKCVIGRKVAFDYNGKRYEKEITEIFKVYWNSWVGDLGFEDDGNDHSDSFLIHGDVDEKKNPLMQGLTIQYDSKDGSRHGYIQNLEVL